MAYIPENLMTGEHVEHSAEISSAIFIPSLLFITAGILLSLDNQFLVVKLAASLFHLIGGVLWLRALLRFLFTELAMTNQRFLFKEGFIRRQTAEIGLANLEVFHVEQSVAGRLLCFGTVYIRGNGGTLIKTSFVHNPFVFRSQTQSTMNVLAGTEN